MEKRDLIEKIIDNVKQYSQNENDLAKLQYAIYQREIKRIKEHKLDEIRYYFENEAAYYGQNVEKFDKDIEVNVSIYKCEIEKLISIYDSLYSDAYKLLQNAINNQKIAIANIVTLNDKRLQTTDENEKKQLEAQIFAYAEKKLNYSVIAEECRRRIDWCIENLQLSINNVFVDNSNQIIEYDDSAWQRIKRAFSNRFSGRSKLNKVIEDYRTTKLKSIKEKNDQERIKIYLTVKGFVRQVDEAKFEISQRYAQKATAVA